MPARGSAAAKLGAALAALDRRRLPVHATEPARLMVEALAKGLGGPKGLLLRSLLAPSLSDGILGLMGDTGKFFDPILHNTVNATVLRAGGKINVVPGEATAEFDARILPGFGVAELLSELREALASGGAEEPELEVLFFDEGPAAPDLSLFGLLSDILAEAAPGGLPVPFMVSGVTDARFFSRLGIQTYGFTPMRLPPEIDFSRLIHGTDERVPAEALGFGARAMGELLARYRG
jgi:acetylornithine deacetylase/succinyl-diaminopimelate desuccinylase-like protein